MDERKWRQATEQDVGMWARYVVKGEVGFEGHLHSTKGGVWAALTTQTATGGVRQDDVLLQHVEVSE